MKRRVCLLLSIVFVMLSAFSVCSCTKVQEPEPRKYKCSVRYLTGEGGYIEGETYQELTQGEDATPVKFIANEGYVFLEWSDGNTSAERHDLAVEHDLQVTAKYHKLTDSEEIIHLDYRYGTVGSNSQSDKLIFNTFDFKKQVFPVLTRDHYTFRGWYIDDVLVADADGKMVVGKEIFTEYHGYKYVSRAKWTANETFDYKVLLVYFENTTVEYTSEETGDKCTKRYIMTEEKRQEYRQLTADIEKTMDEVLDGLVDFQVDEYYVVSPKIVNDGDIDLSGGELIAENIAEISDIAEDYKAVFSLSDFPEYLFDYKHKSVSIDKDGVAHVGSVSGYAHGKYSEVFLDMHSNISIAINTLLHEFVHIIEYEVFLPDYHKSSAYFTPEDYLNNSATLNGKTVGVPYEYWAGNIYKVKYDVFGYLYIKTYNGEYEMSIYETFNKTYGSTLEVSVKTFIYDNHFRFIGWSDGVMTPDRTDIITGDLEVRALYEKIDEDQFEGSTEA